MAVIQISNVVHRGGTSGELPDALEDREIGVATDTGEIFIGAAYHPSVSGRRSYPYQNIKILTELDVQRGIRGDVYYHGALASASATNNGVRTSLIPLFKHGQREFATYDFSLMANNGTVKIMGVINVCVHPSDPNQSVVVVEQKAALGWNQPASVLSSGKFSLNSLDNEGNNTGTTWLALTNDLGYNFILSVSGREWTSPLPAFGSNNPS